MSAAGPATNRQARGIPARRAFLRSIPPSLPALFALFSILAGATLGLLPQSLEGADSFRYRARISERDRRNSGGTPLGTVEQILRQDRANYHRGMHRDPDDQGDPAFADARMRERLETLARNARIDPAVRQAILGGSPLIEVSVSGLRGRSPTLTVTFAGGGAGTAAASGGAVAPAPVGAEIRYRARISERDRRNSAGGALDTVGQILRQDRANYHRGMHRDPDDQGDPAFADARMREMLEKAVDSARLDPALRRAILHGTPLIEVSIGTGAGGTPVLSVSQLPEGGAAAQGVAAGTAPVFRGGAGGAPSPSETPTVAYSGGSSDLEDVYRSMAIPPGSRQGSAAEALLRGRDSDIALRSASLVSDGIRVHPQKVLRARNGALFHGGTHALLETAPGILETWDLQSNLLLDRRSLGGLSVEVMTRAAEPGWMLCVGKGPRAESAIHRVPVRPDLPTEVLWVGSPHFEYLEPGAARLLYLQDPVPGGRDGEFLANATNFGYDPAAGRIDTTVRVRPEEGSIERHSATPGFDRWIEEKMATDAGRRLLRVDMSQAQFGLRPSLPIPGEFSQIVVWAREADPSHPAARYLSEKAISGESFRFLDEIGGRELLQRPLPVRTEFEQQNSVVWKGFPVYVRDGPAAPLRRIGHRSPIATVQGLAADGGRLLIRLANPDPESTKLRYGFDPWIKGYREAFFDFLLVEIDLGTLLHRTVARSESEISGAYSSEGQIVLCEVDGAGRTALVSMPDVGEAGLRKGSLPLGRFRPHANTSRLCEIEPGSWELSFVDFGKCDPQVQLDDPQGCCWHAGFRGGRYPLRFRLVESGISAIDDSGCRHPVAGAGFAKATIRPTSSLPTLAFSSDTLPERRLSLPATGGRGKETPSWWTNDGDRLLGAFSPSGERFFISRDEPYRGDTNSFEILAPRGSTFLRRVENHTTGSQGDSAFERISGEAFCWTGEDAVFFATESLAAILRASGGPAISATPRSPGGLPNRAVYDSIRHWAFVSRDNAVDLFDLQPAAPTLIASISFDSSGEPLYIDSSFRFAGNLRDGAASSIEHRGRAYDFTQLDGLYNQPDALLSLFGADPKLVEDAKRLRQSRGERLGHREGEAPALDSLPEVALAGALPTATETLSIRVPLRADSRSAPLSRIEAYSNGVPTDVVSVSAQGASGDGGSSWEGEIVLPLLPGENRLGFVAVDQGGRGSLELTLSVASSAKTAQTLYVAALGVSDYGNPADDLRFAAKDALGVAAFFESQGGSGGLWDRVETLCLTDGEVTKESIRDVRAHFAAARPQDAVILFVAGHGLLDENLELRFATSDFDFSAPHGENGIAYDALEEAVAESPALRKLVLLDTCHSGELDADELDNLALPEGSGWVAVRRQPDLGVPSPEMAGLVAGRRRVEHFFADLRRATGATVIGSSSGSELSWEPAPGFGIANGIFTHCLLECLKGKAGDADGDGVVDLAELRRYVEAEVARLTNGHQRPSSRSYNLWSRFPLAKIP